MNSNYFLYFLFFFSFNFLVAMDRLSTTLAETAGTPDNRSCIVCLTKPEQDQKYTLLCQHVGCRECLSRAFTYALQIKSVMGLKCSDLTCGRDFDESDLLKLSDTQTVDVLKKIKHREHMLTLRDVKPCPTTNCEYLFFKKTGFGLTTECRDCLKIYCATCIKDHLRNMSCEKAQEKMEQNALENPEEREKLLQEKESEGWITKNTKQCPHCKVPVQKKKGCQKVRCLQCKTLFKWNPQTPKKH